MRTATLSLLAMAAMLLLPAGAGGEIESDLEVAGIWAGKETDLIVRRTGASSWMGSPTELPGLVHGVTWHFESISGNRMKFWILLEGKATTQKLDVQLFELDRAKGEMKLEITMRKRGRVPVTLRRLFAPVPKKIGEVAISFDAAGSPVPANQDVDLRLVRVFERAVALARKVDPNLKRINIGATIERNKGRSKLHSRYVRRAIGIDKVNGAESKHWNDDIAEKLKALKAGERPTVDERRDYAHHATALVAALLIQKDVEFVICPEVLSEKNQLYLDWWIGKYGARFGIDYRSIVAGWRTRQFDPMLKKTRSEQSKMKGWLFFSVRAAGKEPVCRKAALEKKFDRK